MGALLQILYYSLGSIFLGIFLTVAGVVLMFYLIKSWYKNSTFTAISFIVGGLLTIFLSVQMILLCGAVTIKGYGDDVEDFINEMVATVPSDVVFDREDSQQILDNISREWPLVGYFVGGADFTGHTPADIALSMVDELQSFMNKYILRRALWSLFFVLAGAFSVIKSMDIARGGGRRGKSQPRRRSFED